MAVVLSTAGPAVARQDPQVPPDPADEGAAAAGGQSAPAPVPVPAPPSSADDDKRERAVKASRKAREALDRQRKALAEARARLAEITAEVARLQQLVKTSGPADKELADDKRQLEDAVERLEKQRTAVARLGREVANAELTLEKELDLAAVNEQHRIARDVAAAKAEAGLTASELASIEDVLQRLGRNRGLATLQQLTAARGGTLGITSVTPIDGLQANLDAQLFGRDANIYAQFGGLEISDSVRADVFAESMEEDLPRVHFGVTPEKKLATTRLSTVGIRIRRAIGSSLRVAVPQSKPCLAALKRLDRDRDAAAAGPVNIDCRIDEIMGTSAKSLSFGVRLLQRSALEDGRDPSFGGAVESMFSYERSSATYTHRAFLGASAMRVNGAGDMLGKEVVEHLRFTSLRLSAGYEVVGAGRGSEEALLPRAGVYGVATSAWWRDPYTNGTAESDIEGTALEAGLYVGGHFQRNFQGVVVLRALKPMGSDELTFILSLVPGGNSVPDGGR